MIRDEEPRLPIDPEAMLDVLGSTVDNASTILKSENSEAAIQAANGVTTAYRLYRQSLKPPGASAE